MRVVINKVLIFIPALLVGLCCLSPVGHAQVLAPSADPGRVDRPPIAEKILSDLLPEITLKSSKPDLPPDMVNVTFVLNSLTLKGARAFSAKELSRFYQPLLGKTIDLKQLYGIMLQIQQLYLDEGYTVSKVFLPEQSIENGNITFVVLEGFVAKVNIDPSFPKSSILDDFATKVLAMRPLNTKKLERLMLILNDNHGLNASAVLSKSDTLIATDLSGLNLRLIRNSNKESDPSPYLSFDNYGSNYIGSGQWGLGTGFNHVGIPYSELFLSGTMTTSSQEMKQGNISYHLPLFGVSGTTLRLSSEINRTEPGGSLDDLDVQGKSMNLSAQISYPIIRQRDKTWLVSGQFEYKNVGTDLLGDPLFRDRIRSVGVTSRYSFSDSHDGLNFIQGSLSKGLDILAARETGSPDLSRLQGHSDFLKAEFIYTRLQAIPNNFDLLFSFASQYAWDPLLSSEEFGFGGGYVGRGYDPSEITGDRGFSTSLELRYNKTLPEWKAALQPYIFYDFGKIWNIDSLDKTVVSAASAGAGFRLNFNDSWVIGCNFAIPLTMTPNNPPQYGHEYGGRILFSLKKEF
jgi:hemolysin activation/secretion protein